MYIVNKIATKCVKQKFIVLQKEIDKTTPHLHLSEPGRLRIHRLINKDGNSGHCTWAGVFKVECSKSNFMTFAQLCTFTKNHYIVQF